MKYQKKTHESKVQTIRIADDQSIIASDQERATKRLDELTKVCKDHEVVIRNMQHERDTISNMIEGVVLSNTKLEADLKSQRAMVNKMKQDIQDRTRECTEMTQKLYTEAQATIVGYKAEAVKLRVIHEEAMKDISQGQA